MGLKTEGEKLCFQGGLFSRTIHVALHTAAPEFITELSGNGYARVAVAETGWTVDAGSGQASNAAAIAFPAPTADWGDPTHVALWDALAAGNLLASAALAHDVPAPGVGAVVSFAIGAITFDITTDA